MIEKLPGIVNENEYYSPHYWNTMFEDAVKQDIASLTEDSTSDTKQELANLKVWGKINNKVALKYQKTKSAEERVRIFREFSYDLLDKLGYKRTLDPAILQDETWIPTIYQAKSDDGSEKLWIVEALSPHGDDIITDPLQLEFAEELGQNYPEDVPDAFSDTYETAISSGIFALDKPPRFVLLISMDQAVLIDRNKWQDGRLIRFNFKEIFESTENLVWQTFLTLLHHQRLAPNTSETLFIDKINEQSQRHAHGVSKDLKYALRESIELLGNEVASQFVEKQKRARATAYQTREGESAIDENDLSRQCLRFMYRLLFIFYIEARPELGFAPMKAESYRKGYSLESLRELELIPLVSDEDKNGFYFHHCITKLFKIMSKGTPDFDKPREAEFDCDFEIHPIGAELFDPNSTKLINKVKIRNEVLQKIIQLMSLSREGKRRGRISYAQLGINQLGAVYESLLSYSGFFAQTDLYEVKKASDNNPDMLEAAYFVKKEDLEEYTKDEIVYDDNEARVYPRGSFIYRLAGRDRENSASYYTPEILTQCLVKYSLKELLKDKEADDILDLTICEPAMGSAAFLVEAVNQLANAYLERKQKETGERITPDKYNLERQRVRAYITDRNTFGVDLNPIAVELGQVSLWLNCIHEGDFVPWFGDQLFSGNSLIGARAEVYQTRMLEQSTKKEDRWYNHGPRAVTKDEPRKDNEIYHFLLPDPGMSDYDDKVVKPYMPEKSERINEWRREFTKPLNTDEIHQLKDLSIAVDKLFAENVKNLAEERNENNDPIEIFGRPATKTKVTDYTEKNQKLAKTRGDEEKNSPAYLRLKTAMNYWCSLWFWPLKDAEMLPSRSELIMDMSLILEGNVFSTKLDFSDQEDVDDEQKEIYADLLNEIESVGKIDINELNEKIPRLGVVTEITDMNRFFHWPVEFGDILYTNGGFDLIVGNPPWIKPKWNDQNVLSEYYPKLLVANFSATKVNAIKGKILNEATKIKSYCSQYEQFTSFVNFIISTQNFSLIEGQANLYKCFIEKSFQLLNADGNAGILHPNGHLTDPYEMKLRSEIFHRVSLIFQFVNEMSKHLFSDVHHNTKFSVNIYRGKISKTNFKSINNLYLPITVDECFSHDGNGPIPSNRDINNNWEIRGHLKRIIQFDEKALFTTKSIMENDDFEDIYSTRLPFPHSSQDIEVLEKIIDLNDKLGAQDVNFQMDRMWDETNDEKSARIIKRETKFHTEPEQMIISGPNFFACNPLAKTPRAICNINLDYDVIDLTSIPENYLPRSNFSPNLPFEEYYPKIRSVSWSSQKLTDYFRCIFRARTSSISEKTSICSIIPPGIAHTHSTESVCFQNELDLINAVGLWSSIPYDFIAKIAGRVSIQRNYLTTLPWIYLPPTGLHRVLQLNCLTSWYGALWDRNASTFKAKTWTYDRLSLFKEGPKFATKKWSSTCGLKTDFARRQALLEIDVLATIALGLNLEDLLYMYDMQFPVMNKYDKETYFDQQGRIVFTNSQNLVGVGLVRSEWEKCKDMTEGSVSKEVTDDTIPGGPVERTITYEAPFLLPNRKEDYGRAWEYFYPKYGRNS